MSNTTKLIVEYLVGGTLTVVAIVLVAWSFFGDRVSAVVTTPVFAGDTLVSQISLAAIFIAIAYALGIVMEFLGERVFERYLDKTRRQRMPKYLEENEAVLENSPILKPFFDHPPEERDVNELAACIGKMRFYVMNHSDRLYADIAAQINRFRLIRVLALVEGILLIAVVWQLIFNLTELVWWGALILILAITVANYYAILSRFGRYCRAVERSYLILLMDQMQEETLSDEASANT